jgi:hypothetical protein
MSSPYMPFLPPPGMDPLMRDVLAQGTRAEAEYRRLLEEQSRGMQPGIAPTLLSLAQLHPGGYMATQGLKAISDPVTLIEIAREAAAPGVGTVRTFRMPIQAGKERSRMQQVYSTSENLTEGERRSLQGGIVRFVKRLDSKAYDLTSKERKQLRRSFMTIPMEARNKQELVDLLQERMKMGGFLNPDSEISKILENSGYLGRVY